MQTFSIKEALKWGWERFKERPLFFIGVLVLFFVINIALGVLTDEDLVGAFAVAGIGQLVVTIVQWWLYIGLVGILLAVYDGKQVYAGSLFVQKGRTLWHYALGTILYFLVVLGGIILLVVPGIIWAIKYHYYIYLIIEHGLGPVEALKESGRITSGYKWTIFGFFLVLGLINLAGVLVLGVGLLVSIPVSLLASVWVYKWLEQHKKNTPVPVQGEITTVE